MNQQDAEGWGQVSRRRVEAGRSAAEWTDQAEGRLGPCRAGRVAVGERFALREGVLARGLAVEPRGYMPDIYPRRYADKRLPVAAYPRHYRDKPPDCAVYPPRCGDKPQGIAIYRQKSGDGPHVTTDRDVGLTKTRICTGTA